MNKPSVSLLLVVRNEEKYIERCLNSLLNQTYDRIEELIIVDGMSEDNTVKVIQEFLNKNKDKCEGKINIKILKNPKKILASGWNIAIKNATGDVVCRIDGHSEIAPDYVEKGIKTLLDYQDKKVVAVGGVLIHKPLNKNLITSSICDLLSSTFGVGNSPFRTDKNGKPKFKGVRFTDTAVYALYWRWIFEEVGFFDEKLKRNQDIQLHKKILERGYKFLTNPEMKITYYIRTSIKSFLKKAYNDGYWVIKGGWYLRHLIPLMFVIYLLLIPFLLLLNFSGILIFYLIPLLVYLSFNIFFSIKDASNIKNTLFLFFLFLSYHFTYGLGSLVSIINSLVERLKCKFRSTNPI